MCKNVEGVSQNRTAHFFWELTDLPNINFYRKYLKSKIISFTVAYVVP